VITLNQTAGTDSQLIWVVKILGDTTTYRFTTEVGGITLSDNYYDPGVIWGGRNGISPIRESVGVGSGGGIGQVSSFTFQIARYSTNSDVSDFFNDFYPATDGERLVSREVNVGFCWIGATTEDEITWLKRYYIEDYGFTPTQIELYCVEKRELEMIQLPYYKVQKDIDDKVSYFPKAPNSSFGAPIPVLYGSFTATKFEIGDTRLAPTVVVDDAKTTVVISSHTCYDTIYGNYSADGTDRYSLFRSIGGGKYYMNIYSSDTAGTNAFIHTITLQNTATFVKGYARIPLTQLGSQSDIDDVQNAVDNNEKTYVTLEGGQKLALRIGENISSSEMGQLSHKNIDHIRLVFCVASNGLGARNFTCYFYNQNGMQAGGNGTPELTGNGHAGSINSTTLTEVAVGGFATETTATKEYPSLPHRIDELITYDYIIRNDEASDYIRVAYGYLELNEILASGTVTVNYSFSIRRK